MRVIAVANQAVEKEATDLLRNQNALLGFLRAEARRVTQELVATDRAYRRSLRGALVASDFGSFPDITSTTPPHRSRHGGLNNGWRQAGR